MGLIRDSRAVGFTTMEGVSFSEIFVKVVILVELMRVMDEGRFFDGMEIIFLCYRQILKESLRD